LSVLMRHQIHPFRKRASPRCPSSLRAWARRAHAFPRPLLGHVLSVLMRHQIHPFRKKVLSVLRVFAGVASVTESGPVPVSVL